MKHFRLIFGLVLIPIGAFLGSCVPFGTGSGIFLGLIVGIALSYLFLTYGPGHKKNHFPTSSYLNHDQQLNGGMNQQAIENTASGAHEEADHL
jgi:hypothetical protein